MSRRYNRAGSPRWTFHVLSFLEIVFCFFITAAVFITLSAPFVHGFSAEKTLLYTAVLMGALYLFSRNWWTRLLFFPLLILAFCGAEYYTKGQFTAGFRDAFAAAKELFFDTALPEGTVAETAYDVLYGCILAAVGITVYAAATCFRKNWATVFISAATFLTACLLCDRKTLLTVILCLLGGTFPLLAEKFLIKNRQGQSNGIRIRSAIAGALIFSAICATTVSFLPSDTGEYHWRPCSDIVADLQSLAQTDNTALQEKAQIALTALDLQKNKKRIGGKIHNTENTVILATVRDTQPRCFRVTTFDTFTGTNWRHSATGYYRMNGPFSDEQRQALSFPETITGSAEFQLYFEQKDIAVCNAVRSRLLFSSANISDFRETARSNNTLLFDDRGELVSVWEQKEDYSYAYSTFQLRDARKLTNQQVAENLNDFVKSNATGMPRDFYEKYTQLPERWSDILSKKAEKIRKDGIFNTVRSCLNTFTALGIKCVDSPVETRVNYSPVDQMIMTKTGNCVQYATGVCMLLREKGIPCRLAAGYCSVPSEEKGLYYLVNRASWCWIEVFLPGIGWIEINPVPQGTAMPTSLPKNSENPSQDKKVPTDTPQDDPPDDPAAEKTPSEKMKNFLINHRLSEYLLYLFVIALIVLTVRIALSYLLRTRAVVDLLCRDERSRYLFYYRDIVSACSLFGIRIGEEDTMRDVEARLNEAFDLTDALPYFRTAERIAYGGCVPDARETAEIRAFGKQTDQILKKRVPFFRFLILRKLFRPLPIGRHPLPAKRKK